MHKDNESSYGHFEWEMGSYWVKACVEAGRLVNEPYEVQLDNHGCAGGPKAGRLRILNKGPKLYSNDADVKRKTLVVYTANILDHIKFQRSAAEKDVAQQSRSQTVGHTWILESIDACSIMPIASRT